MAEEKVAAEETPAWFQRNVRTPAISRFVDVKGASIHYRQWGEESRGKPGILLIHGALAHSHWWDFIAPEFLDDYRVVAMDCSGAGESVHKDAYPAGDSAVEVTAVCDDAGMDGDAFLVAHSLGFHFAIQAALQSRGYYRGLLGLDPAIGHRSKGKDTGEFPVRPPQLFGSRAEAMASFRLKHAVRNPFLVDYVAGKSIKQIECGWTWKADRNWRLRSTPDGAIEPTRGRVVEEMGCPLGVLFGRDSEYFNDAVLEAFHGAAGAENVVTVEDAGHHVHLDQPMVVAREVKRILARW